MLTDYTYSYANGSGADTALTQKVWDNRTNERTDFSYDNLNRLTRAVTYNNTATSAYLNDFEAPADGQRQPSQLLEDEWQTPTTRLTT